MRAANRHGAGCRDYPANQSMSTTQLNYPAITAPAQRRIDDVIPRQQGEALPECAVANHPMASSRQTGNHRDWSAKYRAGRKCAGKRPHPTSGSTTATPVRTEAQPADLEIIVWRTDGALSPTLLCRRVAQPMARSRYTDGELVKPGISLVARQPRG